MDPIPAIFRNLSNDPICHMTLEEYMSQTRDDTITSLSRPLTARSTQFNETSRRCMEESETIDQSQGASIQRLEGMVHQIDKCSQSSISFISNEIVSEFKQVEEKEVDWSVLPKFDYQDPDEELLSLLDCNDEELLKLQNQDGVMTEEELIVIMNPIVDEIPSLHQEVEQLKEDNERMVRIVEETGNRSCCDQIATRKVKFQSMVESSRLTNGMSLNQSSLFYIYEDPFWRIERKESFSRFLESYGASRKGDMPAINNKYFYSFIIINLFIFNEYLSILPAMLYDKCGESHPIFK